MAYMVRNSTFGVILQLIFHRKISLGRSRRPDTETSKPPEASSCDEHLPQVKAETEGEGISATPRVVGWIDEGQSPSAAGLVLASPDTQHNTDDVDNPQNWSFAAKLWITFVIK